MPIPKDKILYNKVKKLADETYKKSSAYKSAFIVKTYLSKGGEYVNDNKKEIPKLKIWFAEKWVDVGDKKYPVLRPSVKVNSKTPLLKSEIDSKNLKEQIKLKQIIKGDKNLPAFKPKTKTKNKL